MKIVLALLLFLAVPLMGVADGLATGVCVLEMSQYESLMEPIGDITKVPSGDLWAASIKTHFMGKAPDKTVGLEFLHDGKTYRLYVTELEGKTLYAVLNITDQAKEILVASGDIAKGREVKETVAGEPFVVVVRTGNFLRK